MELELGYLGGTGMFGCVDKVFDEMTWKLCVMSSAIFTVNWV